MKELFKHIFDSETAKTGSASALGLGSSAYPHAKAFFAEAVQKSTSYDVAVARTIALLTLAYLLVRIYKAVRSNKQNESE